MAVTAPSPSDLGPTAARLDEAGRDEVLRAVDALVEQCRVESLWYLRPDFLPRDDRERIQVLEAIQERCNRDVFQRAGVLKAWLSRHSSAASAGS